jgi:CrcB protein
MGICGGLSTLSALALEVFLSLHAGSVFGALLYIVLTFAGGFVLALLGVRLATWMAEHHRDLDDVHARSHAADEGSR